MMLTAACWLRVSLKKWRDFYRESVNPFMVGLDEPVRLIYANPTFLA